MKQNVLKNEMSTFANILFSKMQYVIYSFFSYDVLWVFNKHHMNVFWMNKNLLIFTSCNTRKSKHFWNNGPSRPLTLETHYFKNTPTLEHYPSQNVLVINAFFFKLHFSIMKTYEQKQCTRISISKHNKHASTI